MAALPGNLLGGIVEQFKSAPRGGRPGNVGSPSVHVPPSPPGAVGAIRQLPVQGPLPEGDTELPAMQALQYLRRPNAPIPLSEHGGAERPGWQSLLDEIRRQTPPARLRAVSSGPALTDGLAVRSPSRLERVSTARPGFASTDTAERTAHLRGPAFPRLPVLSGGGSPAREGKPNDFEDPGPLFPGLGPGLEIVPPGTSAWDYGAIGRGTYEHGAEVLSVTAIPPERTRGIREAPPRWLTP